MAPRKTIKTSYIWNFFNEKPKSDYIAICNLCKQELSFKSTSNNLKKHMERKHPLVNLNINKETVISRQDENINTLNLTEVQDSQPSTSTSQESVLQTQIKKTVKQTAVTSFMRKKMGVTARKIIDDNLMQLFTHDFQPLSVVEDKGFKNFINSLNPSYQLPSRKTISNVMLPALYEEVYNNTRKIIADVNSVTLTTDCWTSRNTENFLAVTAHFIDRDFELKSVMLECASFGDRHTSTNLATELNRIIGEWGLEKKILIVISDNAANIKKAIKEDLKLKHFGCFAHTINLIAQDALTYGCDILDKVKAVVSFFKRSTVAASKLIEQQKLLQRESKKLIQEVATRWNSSYYMIERFIELEEPLRMTLALTDKSLPIISLEEWQFLKEMVPILKPLESITKFISAQNYVTGSSVIILTSGLTDVYSNLNNQDFSNLSKSIIESILKGIKSRLGDLENSNSLIITTFLDPRYKNIGFSHDAVADSAKKVVTSLVTANIKYKNTPSADTPKEQEITKVCSEVGNSIWGNFDRKIATYQPTGTAQSRAIIEIQRYLEEPPVPRSEDPLMWWKTNYYNFPHLSQIFQKKFITVATSVPCERLFSKSGQIISDRRNRLSSEKVKKLLFINCNKDIKECLL